MDSLLIACLLLAAVNGQEVVHTSVFSQNVMIKPFGNSSTYQTLGQAKNFVFICNSSSAADVAFELQILGPGNQSKLEKVSENQTTLGTIFTYNITNYTDDQTIFRCRLGSWFSSNLILTIFYEPIYSNVLHPFGNNGTEVNVTVELIANPPVTTHFHWSLNNSNVSTNSRITVLPDKISFNPLYVSDVGRYVVNGCNNVSCGNLTFDLDVYFLPVFCGNRINFTELVEIATGNNKNLTCSVVAEWGPYPVNITLSTNPKLKEVDNTSTATSVTVVIANASMSDVAEYQCQACYGNDNSFCSFYWFDTYVGGLPDNFTVENVNVEITASEQAQTLVSISFAVTDLSTVPMTGVNFVINQTGFNHTFDINAPLNGQTMNMSTDVTLDDGGALADMSGITMDIFAFNMLGSVHVKSIVIVDDLSDTSWLFLILVIACPIGGLFLILLLCIPCCCLCYKRRKNSRGFKLVSVPDDD